MLASSVSALLARHGIHYGWVMVAIAFLASLCNSAAVSLSGVILLPLTEEFAWTRADVTRAIGVMFVTFALVAPFAGALILRHGLTRMVTVSATLATLALLGATQASERWHLLITFGLLLGTAAGMVSLAVGATVASRWFNTGRGLAMGFLTAAFAAGQLTFLPLAAWLATEYGWRVAVTPAIAGAAASALLFVLFGRDWPADLGMAPRGGDTVERPPVPDASNVISTSFAVLRDGISSPAFWVLGGTFFICGLSSTGIINQHFVPLCADYGVTAVTAASFLAIMGIFNFIGTIGSGWLSDRFDNRVLLAVYYSLRGLSLVLLPFSDFGFWSLLIFAVFFGLDYVATVPPTVKLTGRYFGTVNAPIVFGWLFAAHQAGSAVSAYGGGAIRDLWLSYTPILVAIGIISLGAGLVVFVLRDTGARGMQTA